MGFIQRAFTPPGTGGREAEAIMANAAAQEAASKSAAAVKPPPTAPTIEAAPPAPPQFSPGQAPGAKQRAQVTASSMLGAAATAGQTSKKSVLGG
jgi:hypothetical protein